MRLLVYEINHQADRIIISGITSRGTIRGIWKDKTEPVVDTAYHVELSIDHLTESDIEQCTPHAPMVSANGDMVTFQGICETIDEDVYFVRYDTDWLDMIEVSETTSPKKAGDFISFSASCYDIGIYPYTL